MGRVVNRIAWLVFDLWFYAVPIALSQLGISADSWIMDFLCHRKMIIHS